jgi:hypothetical protein
MLLLKELRLSMAMAGADDERFISKPLKIHALYIVDMLSYKTPHL